MIVFFEETSENKISRFRFIKTVSDLTISATMPSNFFLSVIIHISSSNLSLTC